MRTLLASRTVLYASLVALLSVNAVILLLRLSSLLRYGDLVSTTGGEGQVLYPLWKILHGFPLYEWPYQDNYSLTLYNFGFYHLYAAVIRLSGKSADFLCQARFITFMCALLGFLLFVVLTRLVFLRVHHRTQTRSELTIGVVASLILWFGSASTSWWIVAARPDIIGLVLIVLGLLLLMMSNDKSRMYLGLSAVAFFTAWAMKQSMIGVVVGVLLHLALTRKPQRLLLFGAIYFGLIGLCLCLSSEQYRASTLGAAGIHSIALYQSLEAFTRIWLSNALFLVPAMWVLIRRRDFAGGTVQLLTIIFITSCTLAFVTLGKGGAEKNHAFEALLSGALLSSAMFNQQLMVARVRSSTAVACLLMAGIGIAQVALANRFGVIDLANDQQYRARQAVSHYLQRLPKPIYIRDELLAQPWHTTDGHYPAPVVDHSNYRDAIAKGVFEGPGLLQWIEQRRFSTLVLDPRDPFVPMLVTHGYTALAPPVEIERLGVVVYARDGEASP